jgi:hypothetical protein
MFFTIAIAVPHLILVPAFPSFSFFSHVCDGTTCNEVDYKKHSLGKWAGKKLPVIQALPLSIHLCLFMN